MVMLANLNPKNEEKKVCEGGNCSVLREDTPETTEQNLDKEEKA